MNAPLHGKVALVTGASRGIGAATARSLAEAGARVALAARSEREIAALAKELPNGAFALPLDVSDSHAVDEVVDDVAEKGGRLDIVVNAAGVSERNTVSRGGDEWWERMLRVNLTGTFYVCRAAMRHLPAPGGRVINVGSVLSLFGAGDSAGYSAAKHGVLGLTRALADEVAERGITVNAVCPGWVETDMATQGFERIAQNEGLGVEEARKQAIGRVPLGRILEPVEVAKLVVFLCTDEARGIHGQAIRIDGGTTSW